MQIFAPHVIRKLTGVIDKYHDLTDYAKAKTCSNRVGAAEDCPDCLRNTYSTGIHPIDYSCCQKRYLYISRYLPLRLAAMNCAFQSIPTKFCEKILEKDKIEIVALGDGIGVAIAEAKRFLIDRYGNNSAVRIATCYRVDKEVAWSDIAQDIVGIYKSASSNIEFVDEQILCDFSDTVLQKPKRSDLMLVSYLISELDENAFKNICLVIKDHAISGSIIVLNDITDAFDRFKIIKNFLGPGFNFISDDKIFLIKPNGFPYRKEIKGKARPQLTSKNIQIIITKTEIIL